MVRRLWVAVVVTLVLGGGAGCGRAASPPGGPGDAGQPEPVWVDPECPKAEPGQRVIPPDMSQERGGVPGDFVTAWVLRCRTEIRQVPGEGSWSVLITERADTPAADLVEALRRPSDPPSGNPCTLEMVVPPYFLLVNAEGKAILPAVPTDGCGKPRKEVRDLVDALPYHPISEIRLGRSQSPRSAETGCPDSWKDMIAIDAGRGQPAPARPLWPAPVGSLRVCVYGQISAGELPVGRLETGYMISGAPAAALRDALDAAGPAAPCTTTHTRFAVLTPETRAGGATIELDGCLRIQRPDNTLGQLDQHATTLVTAR